VLNHKNLLKYLINKNSLTVFITVASLWALSQLLFPYLRVFILILCSTDYSLLSSLIFSPTFTLIYLYITFKAITNIKQNFSNGFKVNMTFWKFVGFIILFVVVLQLLTYVVVYYTHEFDPSLFTEEKRFLIDDTLKNNIEKLIFVIYISLPAAMYEEFLFRVLCFDGLIVKYNLAVTLILNNVIFVCFHPYPEFIPAYIIWNTAICLIYYKWKSLPLVIMIHWLGNTLNIFRWWDWF
jgi:membrane protease YdiL (CAAX protease family)